MALNRKSTSLEQWIPKYQELNLAEYGVDAIPKVGIFWFARRIYSESILLTDAVKYGDCLIYEGSHYEAWHRAVAAIPAWTGFDYEEIPRGRVTYLDDRLKPEFIVYIPARLKKQGCRIMAEFKLPSGFVRLDTSDDHYSI